MDLQTLIPNFLSFLNDSVVPFLLAIAFVVFIWNAMRYFILGGGDTGAQEKARSLAMWSIAAFVVIISLWGIVNFLVAGLGLDNRTIVPDYQCEREGGNCREGLDIDKLNDFDFDPNALEGQV